jgi:hypothetical protein
MTDKNKLIADGKCIPCGEPAKFVGLLRGHDVLVCSECQPDIIAVFKIAKQRNANSDWWEEKKRKIRGLRR